uniref:V-SNARE coiled-coil homology domain-containing protein n=1 Tax=Globodera pallida TaxID=36090 RepID=A0A183C5Q8_GLOPA
MYAIRSYYDYWRQSPIHADPSDELQKLLSGIQGAKNIVSEVNSAKRNADNVRRMEELQKKLDFSAVEKGGFFQKFDFRM